MSPRLTLWISGLITSGLLTAAAACGGAEPAPTQAPAAAVPTATQTSAAPQPTSTIAAPVATATARATAAPTIAALVATATTQATAAPTVVPPAKQSGHLIVAIPRIDAELGLHSSPFNGFTSDTRGTADPLVYADPAPIPQRGAFNPAISIVTAWVVAPDSRSVTFKVRKGVEYHQGFGTVTPEDIAWSFNDALRAGNTNPRSGFVGEYQGKWEAVDADTVVMRVKDKATLSPVWLLELSNVWRQTLTVTSPKAAEKFPPGSNMVIGTGPFRMVSAKADDRIVLEAVQKHYRAVPKVAKVTELIIPETATRVAAFKNGEVHITNIPAQLIQDAVSARNGRIESLGEGLSLHIFMSGNHWQTFDPVENAAIAPRKSYKPDAAHPWVSNPNDPASMARGDKFRRALALAVDRDSINKVVGKGLMPAHYTFAGFIEQDAVWKNAWRIPYDPDGAKALLKEIGIPQGFKLPVWVTPDDTALPPEIAEAAAQMWQNIGFDVAVEKTAYAARRPSIIDRSIDVLMYHHMNIGFLDEPKGRLITAAKGGANRGVELPNAVLEKTYWANLVDPDAAKRTQNNVLLQDYLTEHMLSVPIVRYNSPYAVAPEVIAWRPYTDTFGSMNSFETVALK